MALPSLSMTLAELLRSVDAFEDSRLPPLASQVAAFAGPTGCMRLGGCAQLWRDLVPVRIGSLAQKHWCDEHWPQWHQTGGGPQATTWIAPIVNGSEVFLRSGGRLLDLAEGSDGGKDSSVQQKWPRSASLLAELIDNAYVAVARAPEALTQFDARGLSPLHVAARRHCPQLVHLLLTFRAPVDLVSGIDGRTPLHCAAMVGDAKSVQLLVDSRANPQALDGMRRSPLELAIRVRADEAREILIDAMQKGEGSEVTCTGFCSGCTLS